MNPIRVLSPGAARAIMLMYLGCFTKIHCHDALAESLLATMTCNSILTVMCCVGDVKTFCTTFWSNFKTHPDWDRVRHKVGAKIRRRFNFWLVWGFGFLVKFCFAVKG